MFKRPLNIWPRRLVTGTLLAISMMASAGITLTTNADSRLGEVIGSLKQQSGYEFFMMTRSLHSTLRQWRSRMRI